MTAPFAAIWTGEGWDVAKRDLARANAEMVVGQRYVIECAEERSWKAHRRYFALVREAWLNLPEDKARQFPSPKALRKRALIKCGFRNTRSIVCGSKAEALRLSAFISEGDPYAVILVDGATVISHTARSQRGRAMDRDTFKRSSEAVLELLAEMIGVEQGALESAAA
jgi:hypothetical protein